MPGSGPVEPGWNDGGILSEFFGIFAIRIAAAILPAVTAELLYIGAACRKAHKMFFKFFYDNRSFAKKCK